MKTRDSVPELLEPLRNGPIGVATPEEIAAEQKRLLPWLEAQIAALPEERRRYVAARRGRRAGWIAGATLAAAAAAVLALWSGAAPESELETAGGAEGAEEPFATLISGRLSTGKLEILPGSRLGAASLVESSEEAPAVLRGSSGYLAELSPGGQLALGAPGGEPERQELRLERGQVQLTVPKLEPGATLSVLTEDARVIVRGTKFIVALREDDPTGSRAVERRTTCVRVTEGSVEVRRRGRPGVVLGPGEGSGCGEEAPGAAGQAAEQDGSAEERRRGGGASRGERSRVEGASRQRGRVSGSVGIPASTLQQESELLASALAAEQRGDRARARRELRTLLRRHPQSPLANEARAALERLER